MKTLAQLKAELIDLQHDLAVEYGRQRKYQLQQEVKQIQRVVDAYEMVLGIGGKCHD